MSNHAKCPIRVVCTISPSPQSTQNFDSALDKCLTLWLLFCLRTFGLSFASILVLSPDDADVDPELAPLLTESPLGPRAVPLFEREAARDSLSLLDPWLLSVGGRPASWNDTLRDEGMWLVPVMTWE